VAQVLGVATIAEFVESHETLHTLRGMGIDYAQGFALHRPEPIEMLVATVTPRRA
jgi:EAL domain-containing protein (putative c-di-GMP-specific phosphodiesterase class I)